MNWSNDEWEVFGGDDLGSGVTMALFAVSRDSTEYIRFKTKEEAKAFIKEQMSKEIDKTLFLLEEELFII